MSVPPAGAASPAGVRAAPWPQQVRAQARAELRLMLRSGESLLVTLGIPLGILVFFSVVDVLPTGGERPVDFLVPGVMAISVMATGLVANAIQTAFERKYLVLKRLGGTPLPRWGLVLAKGLAVAALLAVQTVAVVVVATLGLGWRPSLAAVPWLVVALVLGSVVFTALGLLMAGTLSAELTLALSNALFLALLLVSGLAFDADALPAGLERIAAALPSGALGTLLRCALDGHASAGAAGVLGAWGVVAVLAATRWFRWEP